MKHKINNKEEGKMINTKALKVLGDAIQEASKIQADYIVMQPELAGLITREQLAEAEIMNYLKSISDTKVRNDKQ